MPKNCANQFWSFKDIGNQTKWLHLIFVSKKLGCWLVRW